MARGLKVIIGRKADVYYDDTSQVCSIRFITIDIFILTKDNVEGSRGPWMQCSVNPECVLVVAVATSNQWGFLFWLEKSHRTEGRNEKLTIHDQAIF